jgi:catechol 2,3-dioxygenase-like lactoylglutathione lyase family enzyme
MSHLRIDHVQITAPRAREREARHFYTSVLGLRELESARTMPTSALSFALDDVTELHVVLVENPFRPPLGDHFALVVMDLEAVKRRLADNNVSYNPSPVRAGYERVFVQDPFGNRIEFLALTAEGALR